MAALVISGNPQWVSGRKEIHKAGAAISAWDAVYVDNSDGGNVKPAQGDAVGTSTVLGVALHAATDDGQVVVALPGAIITSSAADFTAGLVAYLDDGTAGAVTETEADIASAAYKVIVFWPLSTTQVEVIASTAVAKA